MNGRLSSNDLEKPGHFNSWINYWSLHDVIDIYVSLANSRCFRPWIDTYGPFFMPAIYPEWICPVHSLCQLSTLNGYVWSILCDTVTYPGWICLVHTMWHSYLPWMDMSGPFSVSVTYPGWICLVNSMWHSYLPWMDMSGPFYVTQLPTHSLPLVHTYIHLWDWLISCSVLLFFNTLPDLFFLNNLKQYFHISVEPNICHFTDIIYHVYVYLQNIGDMRISLTNILLLF
jgi:hypothetical protein